MPARDWVAASCGRARAIRARLGAGAVVISGSEAGCKDGAADADCAPIERSSCGQSTTATACGDDAGKSRSWGRAIDVSPPAPGPIAALAKAPPATRIPNTIVGPKKRAVRRGSWRPKQSKTRCFRPGAAPTAAATGSGAAGTARYAHVKGEAEEAVKESWPAVVSIFRPAMIIGSRHTVAAREGASCVLVRDAREIRIDHPRTDREGDERDFTAYAGEIGRLPRPRNDGVESVTAATTRLQASGRSGSGSTAA